MRKGLKAKSENAGVINILTNPSFPDFVKIGYADDIVIAGFIMECGNLNRNQIGGKQ